MKRYFSMYLPVYSKALVYMLQSSEYRVGEYLKWYWRVDDFRKVMYRRELDMTAAARGLLILTQTLILIIEVAIIWLFFIGFAGDQEIGVVLLGFGLLFGAPVLVAHLLVLVVPLLNMFLVKPRRLAQFHAAQKIYAEHKATKIAVVGSYGKTTMKELLAAVLEDGFKVAASPENFNTEIAHIKFAHTLDGDEDILILEYGEFQPDDVIHMAELTKPTHAVVTGLNESHLDNFGTLDVTAQTLFGVAEYLKNKNVFVSGMDPDLKPYTKSKHKVFTDKKAIGWSIKSPKVDLEGVKFTMSKKKKQIEAESKMLGAHNIAPLAFVAALAHSLGMPLSKIEKALKKTQAFEHRLSPKNLPGDIVILDDTYNGSIDGVRAGVDFLATVEAKRRIYITPGLVEQGDMSQTIHNEVGLLAGNTADSIYLMDNSVTDFIIEGINQSKFSGDLTVVDQPLEFYENLEAITKSGDVILMQNDWTDNYS